MIDVPRRGQVASPHVGAIGEPVAQKHPEPPHRPEIPHAGRRLRQPEGQRRVGRGEMLEMAEQDDLAVPLLEQVDRGGEAPFQLKPGGGGGWGEFAVCHRTNSLLDAVVRPSVD